MSMLYRYWFYGWLFIDVNRGSLLERAAARRHNQGCSRWLPLYMRRWAALGLFCWMLGCAFEMLVPAALAWPWFVVSVMAVPVNAVTLVAWWGLRTAAG